MTTEVFKDKDWSIMTHDYTYQLNHKYYAMHNMCRSALMDWNNRKCYECDAVVPDHIQVMMAFLLWDIK